MLIAGVVVMTAGCGSNTKKAEAQPQAVVETAPTVSVVQVSKREVPQIATYTSTVQPYVKNNIVPQAGGRITKINVEIGDFVKEGQVLAEIDKAQLQQAQLSLKNQEVELARLKSLYEAGGLSKSDLDAIELQYNVTKTQAARHQVHRGRNHIVVAPIIADRHIGYIGIENGVAVGCFFGRKGHANQQQQGHQKRPQWFHNRLCFSRLVCFEPITTHSRLGRQHDLQRSGPLHRLTHDAYDSFLLLTHQVDDQFVVDLQDDLRADIFGLEAAADLDHRHLHNVGCRPLNGGIDGIALGHTSGHRIAREDVV